MEGLLFGILQVAVGLLPAPVEICDLSFMVADASDLVFHFRFEAFDSGSLRVTIQDSGGEIRAETVGVALESVVVVSQLINFSGSIVVPCDGTLELIIEATLFVEEIRVLVLKYADALT